MPTVSLPDDTYDLLARKAAAVGVSPGEFIALSLSADSPVAPQHPLKGEAWKTAFEQWMAEVAARAPLYPPGFELDVSREAIYDDPRGDGR